MGTTRVDEWLSWDLDEWTRHVVRRHFDPDTGSPYWLKRARELDFEPLEITRYEQLKQFGPFPLPELRAIDPEDLVPLAEPRPLVGRIWDSGGTTGSPCRVYYSEDTVRQRGEWRRWVMLRDGFEPHRAWLQASPSGPHLIGHAAYELTGFFASLVYTIDVDPRWIKRLIRAGRLEDAEDYTDHVIEQIADVLGKRSVQYLSTTPALFQVLLRKHPALVARLEGVRLAGTQITPQMYRQFTDALGDRPLGLLYGNTFGNSVGLPAELGGTILPYLPCYPHVTLAVVDKNDWRRTVAYGEIGRVSLTALQEDLFLPNVLERDQAVRHDLGSRWPCDGVANVHPLQISRQTPEGVY